MLKWVPSQIVWVQSSICLLELEYLYLYFWFLLWFLVLWTHAQPAGGTTCPGWVGSKLALLTPSQGLLLRSVFEVMTLPIGQYFKYRVVISLRVLLLLFNLVKQWLSPPFSPPCFGPTLVFSVALRTLDREYLTEHVSSLHVHEAFESWSTLSSKYSSWKNASKSTRCLTAGSQTRKNQMRKLNDVFCRVWTMGKPPFSQRLGIYKKFGVSPIIIMHWNLSGALCCR